MRKRILSALLAVMFLFPGLPGTAWAVGEGNMEAGGGQTETVTGDSFWNGDWGIRFCVVDVASQTVVSATYDAANKSSGYENYIHFGKTNKFDYRGGASLSFQQSDYSWKVPAVPIPTIVKTSGAPDIKAIKDYFTDETVIRWIGDVTGMAYDTLISGDYKLFIEPILYYTFDSQKYAMTATEVALFDRAINGLLLRTMGNASSCRCPSIWRRATWASPNGPAPRPASRTIPISSTISVWVLSASSRRRSPSPGPAAMATALPSRFPSERPTRRDLMQPITIPGLLPLLRHPPIRLLSIISPEL